MRIFDIQDSEGRVCAFEVSNFFFARLDVCGVVSRIPAARLIRKPKMFSSFREDEFCEFEVEGVKFVAWEPFGDNTRYWIGPEPPRWVPQIDAVREAFKRV
jgi:hypothetical protein